MCWVQILFKPSTCVTLNYSFASPASRSLVSSQDKITSTQILASDNSTWKNNIVPFLHRSDRRSIYVASPTIQNNRILRQNWGLHEWARKAKRVGNISSDAVIMIRSVVPSASWAIEFLLKLETFSSKPVQMERKLKKKKAKRFFEPSRQKHKRVENIFTPLILM